MSSQQKTRVCVLVEGTAAMAPVWGDLRLNYIEPLLRSLDKGVMGAFELALVVFFGRQPHSQGILERGGWTSDLTEFRQWLDAMVLSGGGRCETQLAEAFAEMLYLFRRPSVLGEVETLQRQCVLVVQSDPSKILTPWPFPDEVQPGLNGGLASCEDQAKHFSKHRVNLSLVMLPGPRNPARNRFMILFAMASQVDPKADQAGMQDMWRRCVRQLSPGSTMLVSPNWPSALSVLEQEQAAKRNLPPVAHVSASMASAAQLRPSSDGGIMPGMTPPTESPALANSGGSYLTGSPAMAAASPPVLGSGQLATGQVPPMAGRVGAQGGYPPAQASSLQPVYSPSQAQSPGMPQLPMYPAAPSPHGQRPGMHAAQYPGGQAASPHGGYPPGQGGLLPGGQAVLGSAMPGQAATGAVPQSRSSKVVWQGDVMFAQSIMRAPSAVHLMSAHALVIDSPATANLVLQWPPVLEVYKLTDIKADGILELTKKHGGGIQGRFQPRPGSLTQASMGILSKMVESNLAGLVKTPSHDMIFVAQASKQDDPNARGSLRLGFILFPL